MKLEKTTTMSYSGLSEEINVTDIDESEKFKEAVEKVKKDKSHRELFRSGQYVYEVFYNEKLEKVRAHFMAALATYDVSGDKTDKTLGDFE